MREIIRGSRFDSILHLGPVQNGQHANLTIHMKVCLQQFTPPEGQGELRFEQCMEGNTASVIIGNWEASDDWHGWCRNFEQGAEDFFNGKLWLNPNNSWMNDAVVPGTGGRSVYIPSVRCVFRISRVAMSESHFIADVAKINGDSNGLREYQSQARRLNEVHASVRDSIGAENNPLSSIYRACFAGTGRLFLTDDSLEEQQRTRDTSSFTQRTYLHELGHAIGLDHVNRSGNDDGAYGSNTHQRGDLMGLGERIEAWHAFPWKRRLMRHLQTRWGTDRTWTATTSSPPMRTGSPPIVRDPSVNGPIGLPGGVPAVDGGVPIADAGVATRCSVRGCSDRGIRGMYV